MKNKQFVITQFSDSIESATSIHFSELRALKPTEVLVKNAYVGINALYDRELYRGRVPYISVTFPYVFGVESIGEIVDVGSKVDKSFLGKAVSLVKVGTAYQEYQIVTANDLLFIPQLRPEYLCIYPTGISAYLALEKLATIQPDDVVVVDAAAGGLGHLLIQFCKMKGAYVIATCGSQEKKVFLAQLGSCDLIINYREEDLPGIIEGQFKNKINTAFDSVGGELFDLLSNNLSNLGRLIIIGLASELSKDKFEIVKRSRVYESLYWKGASILCFMNHLYKSEHEEARQLLMDMYHSQTLQVKIDQSEFNGVESIFSASQYLLSGKSIGKVVVKL